MFSLGQELRIFSRLLAGMLAGGGHGFSEWVLARSLTTRDARQSTLLMLCSANWLITLSTPEHDGRGSQTAHVISYNTAIQNMPVRIGMPVRSWGAGGFAEENENGGGEGSPEAGRLVVEG